MMHIYAFKYKNVQMYALCSSVRQGRSCRSNVFFNWLNNMFADVGVQKPHEDSRDKDQKNEKAKENEKKKGKSDSSGKGGRFSGNKGQDKSMTPQSEE